MSDYTIEDLNEKCNVDAEGVYRWKSSDNVVPNDILKGAGFSQAALEVNRNANSVQTARVLKEYAEAQRNRSPEQIAEERYEARAAMGPGVDMVNVFTGERWTT